MRVLLLSGSLRAGSTNTALLRTAAAVAPADVQTVLFGGMADLPHFSPDLDRDGVAVPASVLTLRGALTSADALLLCTPEYAGALPGALKNLLEWAVGSPETHRLRVGWVNAAGPAAPNGGADAHASLRLVLRWLGVTVVEEACVRIPLERAQVGPDGLIADAPVRDALLGVLGSLRAQVLRAAEA